MDNQKGLNELLKWSIENSTQGGDGDANNNAAAAPPKEARGLNADAIRALMGGPSDADLMQAAMAAITSADPEVTLETKLTAFDNLEQLIESLDNANLLGRLGLWTPLLACLGHAEPQIRLMAAWVVGTAVQNNEPCQERLVALGGVEKLAAMALGERVAGDAEEKGEGEGESGVAAAAPNGAAEGNGDHAGSETKDVRRKAVYALSSACRNYQPAMDVLSAELGKREGKTSDKVEATDMEAVDAVIAGLREKATAA